jgi:glucokinase
LIFGSGAEVAICPACGAQFETVLEHVASGAGLMACYKSALPAVTKTPDEILSAATAGDATAVRIVAQAGQMLGNRVGQLVNLLDPSAVIVGGGLGLAGGIYWDAFQVATRAAIWAANSRDVPLLPAALGADAGVIGAALSAWERSRHLSDS